MTRAARHRFRPVFIVAGFLFAVLLAPAGLALDAPELRDFAARVGLRDAASFAETVTELRATGMLPPRYVTKDGAERLGWKPGADLCRAAPGRIIGGDSFANRERRLPDAAGRRWREADLDYGCGSRGARRLVWSTDGLIFVTLDHYASFVAVPGAPR